MISISRNCLFHYLATLSCSLSMMSYGINFSWTSPYLPILTSNTSIIPMTSEEGSWCAISPIPGCVIGALISANLADRIGRKHTILVLAPVVLACFVAIGYVRNYWWLLTLRMVIGIADGAAFALVPMYVGEIVEPQFRGFLASLSYLFYVAGGLVINIIGPAYSIFGSSMISAAIPAIHFLSFAFMPESPYYLVKANKCEQAEHSLRILRGNQDIRKTIEALKDAAKQEAQLGEKPVLGDIWRVPSNRKACFIFLIASLASRAAAKAPLISYTMAVFEEAGTNISTVNSTIAYCTVELVVAFITTCFIIDRFGKRFLVIVSSMGCVVTLAMMAVYFFLKYFDHAAVEYLGWFPLATLITYNVLFNIGLAFAQMCYLSELFPMNVKANALSLAEIWNCLSSAFCIKMFQMLTDWSGTLAVTFLVFAVWSLVLFVFIVKYVPETKGKSLEEIQVFLILSTVPTIVCIVGLIWASESPRYLLEASREVEALAVYQRLHRLNNSRTQYGLTELELPGRSAYRERMSPTRNIIKHGVNSFREAFQFVSCPANFRSTLLLASLHFLLGFLYTGLTTYTSAIMQDQRDHKYFSDKQYISNENYTGVVFNSTLENREYQNALFKNATFTHLLLNHVGFVNCTVIESEFIDVKASVSYFKDSSIIDSRFIDTDLTTHHFVNCSLINNTFLSVISDCTTNFDYNNHLEELHQETTEWSTIMAVALVVLGFGLECGKASRRRFMYVAMLVVGGSAIGILFMADYTKARIIDVSMRVWLTCAVNALTLVVVEGYPCHLRCTAHGMMRSLFHIASLCAIPIYNVLVQEPVMFSVILTVLLALYGAFISKEIQDNSKVLL
ncbi:unnamed protein product [Phaedon cochleariae]|nr:unnamed protein product [Phaedon cochleariae]